MNKNKNKKIKNLPTLITGIIAASVYSLIMCEAIQGFAAFLEGASGIKFGMTGMKLFTVFSFTGSVPLAVFLYSIPFWLMTAGMSLPVFGLSKTEQGRTRYFFMVFSLTQAGFLIFNLFHGAFSIILKVNKENDWVGIVKTLKLDETGAIIFMFIVIVITAGYLNLLLKRILKYINI